MSGVLIGLCFPARNEKDVTKKLDLLNGMAVLKQKKTPTDTR